MLVLHVDDPSITRVASGHLEADDAFRVLTAETSEEALDRLSEGGVDCVVSDYRLPDMDGLKLLRHVREAYPDLPFVLFTGKGSEEVASDAIAAGVTDYLQKRGDPDQYSLLANRIENAVGQYRAERAASRRASQQEAVASLGKRALRGDDVDDLYAAAVERVADALDVRFAAVFERDSTGQGLALRAAYGWDEDDVRTVGPNSHPGHALTRQESVVVTDAGTGVEFDPGPLLADDDVESGVCVSIGGTGDPWGVLAVHHDRPRAFSEHDVNFLLSVGHVLVEGADRRQRMRELEGERDRLAALFDNTIDPTIEYTYVDGERIVQDVNAAFEETFGYSREAAVGAHVDDLVVPSDKSEEAARIDRRIRTGERIEIEVRRRTADGELRDFLLRNIPIQGADGPTGFAVYTDVTGRNEREQRLQVLNRVLRHDLRNDMNVVLGIAELVESQVDDDDLRAELASLQRVAERLLDRSAHARIIEETLENDWIDGRTVDVVGLVERVVAEFGDEYPAASVAVDVPESAVAAAGPALGTAIEELLANALEHNDADEPHVEVSVSTTDDDDDRRVVVEVADDGPGIPAHERTVLVAGTETPLEHGSGLGLWLVRWIVHGAGGDLSFESRDPRGSRVTVTVPAGSVAGGFADPTVGSEPGNDRA